MIKIDGKNLIQYNQLILRIDQTAELDLIISNTDKTKIIITFHETEDEEKKPLFELKNMDNGTVSFILTDWNSSFRAANYNIGTSDDGKNIFVWILVQAIGKMRKMDLEFLVEP